jgi:hypothetical protein
MSSFLVIGEHRSALRRATDLRMRGFGAWIAVSDRELGWLLEHAWARPAMSLVDLSQDVEDREQLLAAAKLLAASARLPAVLIGAREGEAAQFERVLAQLPGDVDIERIVALLAR